jgi:membrane dipeptidase
MTLTWNNSTSWGTSAFDETRKKDSLPHKGLTDFGKQVVKKMNELGMIVDISHVGETNILGCHSKHHKTGYCFA